MFIGLQPEKTIKKAVKQAFLGTAEGKNRCRGVPVCGFNLIKRVNSPLNGLEASGDPVCAEPLQRPAVAVLRSFLAVARPVVCMEGMRRIRINHKL